MQQENFEYQVADQAYHATLFYKKEWQEPRPTVLIYHAFEGVNDLMKKHATRFVDEMKVAAITLDVYGNGRVASTFEDCVQSCMALINNRDTLHKRLVASVAAAKARPQVNADKMAAIGFCFGGLCVLDIARAGIDLKGVMSIHGVLAPPPSHLNSTIKAKVLVCHGYDDPQISKEQIDAFMQEMNTAQADWQFMFYSHAKHAFTDPEADKIGPPSMGREYNALATQRAWRLVMDFCNEVLLTS